MIFKAYRIDTLPEESLLDNTPYTEEQRKTIEEIRRSIDLNVPYDKEGRVVDEDYLADYQDSLETYTHQPVSGYFVEISVSKKMISKASYYNDGWIGIQIVGSIGEEMVQDTLENREKLRFLNK